MYSDMEKVQQLPNNHKYTDETQYIVHQHYVQKPTTIKLPKHFHIISVTNILTDEK